MKPLRLKLKGFTSFRDEQEIDFVDLDLFAIWGPTGSGKSSLLDAITYALYGEVERVGHSAAQLISQGQPRLSVLFEFEVDGVPYRVHRQTPTSGSSKVLLERQEADGSWASFGEGADKVRDVKQHIEGLVGLDYTAFTRSVVLPQGKFAEFMTGEPKKRREILTDLLGLELFGRMASHANQIARTAKSEAEAKADLVEREYAGVGETALAAARAEAQEAKVRLEQITGAIEVLEKIAARWDLAVSESQKVNACALEFRGLAGSVRRRAEEAREVADRADGADARVAAARAALDEAARRRAEAADALRGASSRMGKRDQLIEARARTERLADAERAAAEADESSRAADAKHAGLGERRAETTSRVTAADAAEAAAVGAMAAADEAYHAAHRADHVGALIHGLPLGAPCPICERPLESLLRVEGDALARAERDTKEARRRLDSAHQAATAARHEAGLLEREIEVAAAEVARCRADAARREGEAAIIRGALAAVFGGDIPDDPAAEIERRLEELNRLEEAAAAAADAERVGEQRLAKEEQARDLVASAAGALAASLRALDVRGALGRAGQSGAEIDDPGDLDDLSAEIIDIAPAAAAFADRLDAAAAALERHAEQRRAELPELTAETRAAVPEWITSDGTEPAMLLREARARAQECATAEAQAAEKARHLETRLDNLRGLQTEIAEARSRHAVYRVLAHELKADRLIAFLQGEALRLLAAAGSERLSYLSGGRYRLAFESDEFYVVDAWNGEDRRSARTLSGGETFLASLALALALSEQVRILAVGEKAALDSLFLDEGFGTLDAETLETVVSAIEQLGGDERRMVGVITHVADLAERLPQRLVVTKSPRGSTITRESV